MRLKFRYTTQQKVVQIADDLTLIELLSLVNENADNFNEDADLAIKFGFPPKLLQIEGNEVAKIQDLGVKNGEVMIINYVEATPGQGTQGAVETGTKTINNPDKIPYIETEVGYLALHKVADDNSCLFHSILYSTGAELFMSVHDLRTIVSNSIKENADGLYSELILGKPISQYAEWILNPQAWGGEIEINILLKFFKVEIITVDIESRHDYKFNEDLDLYIILLYSGIHYDSIVYRTNPNFQIATSDVETGKFFKTDLLSVEVRENYSLLSSMLNTMGYFTNTRSFQIKCGDCGKKFIGEKDASEHASETGHVNFEEST